MLSYMILHTRIETCFLVNSISQSVLDSEMLNPSDVLFNHTCSTLSELDMEMIRAVPEGGNWQNIPTHVIKKSARLTQIRKSGGRTTYYGRMKDNLPSYTINTYFNRPGNGTFIHPKQDRLISMREAARLQSFPDRFRFLGSRSSRYKQIGNAVPPLLAGAVAKLFKPGKVVDLFSGAGGLSEGFVQAGHEVILAADSNSNMCETYAYNHPTTKVVQADMHVQSDSLKLLEEIERALAGKQLDVLVGGPPCQGFSTAGNRNASDSRNRLVFGMLDLVRSLQPDAVVIENVPGLKRMQNGAVLNAIDNLLRIEEYSVAVLVLKAEEFAVPQRRRRIFVVGQKERAIPTTPKKYLASIVRGRTRNDVSLATENLPPPVNVSEAISDLPPILSGCGDDIIEYQSDWTDTDYQRLMRESISFDYFIAKRTEQG
ncbi:MAG: DNA cytosine methyltransferase [Candidatus Thorarchaeota archaeon]|nr:DNA cytosine methyltransferase [Candidatus Thorarchaeota archaeon]